MTRPDYQMISHGRTCDCCIAIASSEVGQAPPCSPFLIPFGLLSGVPTIPGMSAAAGRTYTGRRPDPIDVIPGRAQKVYFVTIRRAVCGTCAKEGEPL